MCKILIKCYNEKHTEDIETTSMDDKNISNNVANNENQQLTQQTKNEATENIADECLLCSEQKRDTVFKPCGHVVSCEACGSRIKKCLICRETVSSREKVRLPRLKNLSNFKFSLNFINRSTNVSSARTVKLPCFSSLAVTWWRAIIVRQS